MYSTTGWVLWLSSCRLFRRIDTLSYQAEDSNRSHEEDGIVELGDIVSGVLWLQSGSMNIRPSLRLVSLRRLTWPL